MMVGVRFWVILLSIRKLEMKSGKELIIFLSYVLKLNIKLLVFGMVKVISLELE